MGNAPSAEAARRPSHRLSKPRTGNPSTAGLLSNSTHRFSSLRLNGPLPLPPSTTTTTPSASVLHLGPSDSQLGLDAQHGCSVMPPKRRESKRRSLFRSKSSQGPRPRDDEEGTTGPSGALAAGGAGRANSMTYESSSGPFYGRHVPEHWPTSPSRTSWACNLTSYEAKRLLSFTEDSVEQLTVMSENRMTVVSEATTVVSEATWKTSHPAEPASTPITRANSDLSLYTPVRRRSLIQTPGVATRTYDRVAPSRPRHRMSMPPSPSMSRPPSFVSETGRVMSMPPRPIDLDSIPRVVTPCETEYLSIGAFKLGSLRITNGAASPASPEMERKHVEGHRTSASLLAPTDYFSKGGSKTVGTARTLLGTSSSTSTPSPASADSGLYIMKELPACPFELNRELLSEISPLSNASELQRLELMTTSKHSALEDHLFDDDGQQPEYYSKEILDIRVDPNAKSQTAYDSSSSTGERILERVDSALIISPTSDYHKPLTKADSGYSSSVSLRSFRMKPRVPEKEDMTSFQDKHASASTNGQRHGSISTDSAMMSSPEIFQSVEMPLQSPGQASPPPVPPKDDSAAASGIEKRHSFPLKETASRRGPPARLSSPSISRRRRGSSDSSSRRRSLDEGPRSPDSIPLTPASTRSEASTGGSASALSIGSGSNRPSKLQRLLSGARRSSNGPPTVHAVHDIERTTIPSVPQHVEARLHQHTGLFPITTKRLALKHQTSKDTLKTIFSVGSMEISRDETAPPVPSISPLLEVDSPKEPQIPNSTDFLEGQPTPMAHATAFLIPRKPIARKPVPQAARVRRSWEILDSPKGNAKEDEARVSARDEEVQGIEAQLTTYSAINTSLGANPYDAAVQTLNSPPGSPVTLPAFAGRTMSMTVIETRNASLQSAGRDLNRYHHSPTPPSPSFFNEATDLLKKARTPPPVSMMTRPGSTKLLPPARPQSTPVGLRGHHVNRRNSRERMHSYYPSRRKTPPVVEQDRLLTSSAPPPIPPMNPRRSQEFRQVAARADQPTNTRMSKWEPHTYHNVILSPNRGPFDNGRSLSLTSNPERLMPRMPQMPSNYRMPTYQGQPSAPHGPKPPVLRHRASYDGFSRDPSWNSPAGSGGAPPMPRHGHGHGGPPPMLSIPLRSFDPLQFAQMDQGGRYPPHQGAQGQHQHQRASSLGGRSLQGGTPFRVLHSYNSPAYRNVPIWG